LAGVNRQIRDYFAWRIIWWLSYLIGKTARFRIVGMDRMLEYRLKGLGLVLLLWHGRTLLPIYCCRNKGLWAIISLSRDGEMQNRIVSRYGYRTIRGSSGKKGARAFLESVHRLRGGELLAITPDGPKGPDRQVQLGSALLAFRAGCCVLPVGASARPRKLLKSWDSYMVPAPFCRAAIVFGEPLQPPTADDERTLAEWSARVRMALDDVEEQAEKMTLRHG
jgi:lysophospholipid acyltransferase (LPLAT)-like uncharacterized protein